MINDHFERPTVLVVDDEVFVRNFLTTVLQRKGYGVRSAGDGQEALEVLQRQPECVQLLLTDIDMPRKNGIELMGEVRSFLPRLPIVVMSGILSKWEDKLRGVSCISKPFAIDTLLTEVKDALANAIS